MEDDIVSEFIGNVDLDFGASLGVGVEDGLGRLDKLEAVVEEHGSDEWKRFEVLEADGLFEHLPVGIAGSELLAELVRVGEEVVFVVLVADLVSVLLDRSRVLVL